MMIVTDRLVHLIELHADKLTKRWLADVRKNEMTPTYHSFDPDKLYDRAHFVYRDLGKWISQETSKEAVAERFLGIGKQRVAEGFQMSEVVQALVLVRRHLWLEVLNEGFLDTALDYQQALMLNNRVVLFFDRAIYYMCVGYESAMCIGYESGRQAVKHH